MIEKNLYLIEIIKNLCLNSSLSLSTFKIKYILILLNYATLFITCYLRRASLRVTASLHNKLFGIQINWYTKYFISFFKTYLLHGFSIFVQISIYLNYENTENIHKIMP